MKNKPRHRNLDDQVGYTSKSLRMLKTKEGQLNAVFACFGSAAQHSYFFEAALGEFLLVYNKILKKSLTLQDLETIETKIQKKTMGALLSEFRKYVKIHDSTIEQYLDNALKKRNFLIPHFFRQRQKKFHTEKGRMEMLKELVGIEKELEQATDLTNGMRVALSKAVSIEKNKNIKTDERDSDSQVLFTISVNIPE